MEFIKYSLLAVFLFISATLALTFVVGMTAAFLAQFIVPFVVGS